MTSPGVCIGVALVAIVGSFSLGPRFFRRRFLLSTFLCLAGYHLGCFCSLKKEKDARENGTEVATCNVHEHDLRFYDSP